jgi:hypothetical protein
LVNPNSDIQLLLVELLTELNGQTASLNKEYKYLESKGLNEGVLKAKNRQINSSLYLKSLLDQVFDLSQKAFELQEKTELCLINYGVSYCEFMSFINKPINYIIDQAKENKKDNSIQLPIVFRDLLYSEPKPEVKEIKHASKPTFNIDQLKVMAGNNPGYLKTGINGLNQKMQTIKI